MTTLLVPNKKLQLQVKSAVVKVKRLSLKALNRLLEKGFIVIFVK